MTERKSESGIEPNLRRAVILALAFIAIAVGIDLIFDLTLPGTDKSWVALWVALVTAVLVAGGVFYLRWWQAVGYTPARDWRELTILLQPSIVAIIPILNGVRIPDGGSTLLIVATAGLAAFAQETLFRGVMVKLLERRSPMMIAVITALLFGLVHLGMNVDTADPLMTLGAGAGAAAFGFGYAAVRQRINALLPLVALHMLAAIFLAISHAPAVPMALLQGVLVGLFGLSILLRWKRPR